MGTNYKQILEQAKQEKDRSQNQRKPTSLPENRPDPTLNPQKEADQEETVNLCVRVPKSWRTKVKASAISHDLTLEKLVVEAVNRYMEQEKWV